MFNPEAFVKYKDLPNLTQMFGNLGNSWNNPLPNDLYIKGVPKNVLSGGNFVGNVGTGLDTLRSFTFPAKSLRAVNDSFKALLGGGFGTNDDNKRIQLTFGGVLLFDTTLLDFDGQGWRWELTVVRLSTTLINACLSMSTGNFRIDSGGAISSSGGQQITVNHNVIAINNMDTNSNILLL